MEFKEPRTSSNITSRSTEFDNCIGIFVIELDIVQLDRELVDGIGKMRWERLRVGLVDDFSRHFLLKKRHTVHTMFGFSINNSNS